MFKREKKKKKEIRKFILILCGLVFSLTALIPLILYLTGAIGIREEGDAED